jgi:hypothetical protein
VAEVATAFGLSWPTAHAAVIELAARELDEPAPILALGIDETRRGRPRWAKDRGAERWVRTDAWDTGFVDLAGAQGLLGQVQGRIGGCVVDWLQQRTPEFRAGDPVRGHHPAAVYAKAVRAPGLLPNAVLVVDHFHIVALASDLGAGRPPRPQDRPGVGQSPPAAHRSRQAVAEVVFGHVERADRLRPQH